MNNNSENHKDWSRALLNVAYADLLENSKKLEYENKNHVAGMNKDILKIAELEKELAECKDFVSKVARHDFELSEMCCYMVVEAAQKVLKDIRK